MSTNQTLAGVEGFISTNNTELYVYKNIFLNVIKKCLPGNNPIGPYSEEDRDNVMWQLIVKLASIDITEVMSSRNYNEIMIENINDIYGFDETDSYAPLFHTTCTLIKQGVSLTLGSVESYRDMLARMTGDMVEDEHLGLNKADMHDVLFMLLISRLYVVTQ